MCGRPRSAAGEVRIGIFAKEDVQPGVEITYDYMFQHHGLAAAAAAYRRATPDTPPLSAQPLSAVMPPLLHTLSVNHLGPCAGVPGRIFQVLAAAGAGAGPRAAAAPWTASRSAFGTLGSAWRCGQHAAHSGAAQGPGTARVDCARMPAACARLGAHTQAPSGGLCRRCQTALCVALVCGTRDSTHAPAQKHSAT